MAKRVSSGVNYFTGEVKFKSVLTQNQKKGLQEGETLQVEELASPDPLSKLRKAESLDSIIEDAEEVLQDALKRGVTTKNFKGAKEL
jgi:hypothetical protein